MTCKSYRIRNLYSPITKTHRELRRKLSRSVNIQKVAEKKSVYLMLCRRFSTQSAQHSTYVFKFLSANRILGSRTTLNRANVDARPILLVAWQIYRPESWSFRSLIFKEHTPLSSVIRYRSSSLSNISHESRYHLILENGSPRT